MHIKNIQPKIVIAVSSGIAAYKILDLIQKLKNKKCHVTVAMTNSAAHMISPMEFEKVTGNKVYIDLFPKSFRYETVLEKKEVDHIQVADLADICVVAPATANILGKVAHGIADDFVTTTLLATRAPILLCPSMNVHMWENQIVQENLIKLQKRGMYILHPDSGALACGYTGIGRLPQIEKIEHKIFDILRSKNLLKGKKILITAGGTTEPIDPVRFISNRASGKMGIAIAEACFEKGADVLLLKSKSSVSSNRALNTLEFETGEDLLQLVEKYTPEFDVIFHTAAVSDYKSTEKYTEKLDSKKPLTLHLETTTKILSQIKRWNKNILLVGFKAVYKEDEQSLIEKAKEKLRESNANFIVANDVGRNGIGFDSDENEVYLVSANDKMKKIEKTTKSEIARQLIDIVLL